MNQDQVMGLLRTVAPAVLAYAVGKGWLSDNAAGDITAAVVTIGGAIWSIYMHTQQAKIASVAAMPEVKQIVTTAEVAKAAPSDKVTNGFVVPEDKKKP